MCTDLTLRILADWFIHYPIIGFTLALLLWIVSFRGLKGMGLPDVFWRYEWYASALGGVGIAIVFSISCFVGFLLASNELAADYSVFEYAKSIYWLLVLVLLIGCIRELLHHDTHSLALLGGFVAGACVVRALAITSISVAMKAVPWFRERPSLIKRLFGRGVSPEALPWHIDALAVAGLVLFFYLLFATFFYRYVVASFAICGLLTLVLLTYGWLTFRFGGAMVAVLGVAVALMFAADIIRPRRYRYPELAALYEAPPVALAPGANPNLIPMEVSLGAWRTQFGDKKPKLLIIAASGGGIRAAAWTSALLHALNRQPDLHDWFTKSMRIVTGASGGLVGAADFVAGLFQDAGPSYGSSSIADNALDHVARALVLRDVPKLILPGSWKDRGVALEERWGNRAPRMLVKFQQLRAAEEKGALPSLIFSPMFVEDGRRLLVSNLDLSQLAAAIGPEIPTGPDTLYSRRAVEMFKLFPGAERIMPLVTAARMNASFPFVSPAAELPTSPRRHIVDAGYYDNYGVATATAWIASNRDWLMANTAGVAILEIRDSSLQDARTNVHNPDDSLLVNKLGELVAPFIGAISSALTVQAYHNDNDEERINELLPRGFFTRMVFEYGEELGGGHRVKDEAPLSWSLTSHERRLIDAAAVASAAARAAELAQWWTT